MENGPTFFVERKRRRVVRVAVVYCAGAFVALQAADIMLPRLGVPEWALSLLVVLAILGLAMAVLLGWAFEALRGDARFDALLARMEQGNTRERARVRAEGIAAEVDAMIAAGPSRREAP